MTEGQLIRAVIELCGWLHLTTAHFRPAWTEQGWRTAVQGDGKGFPDLVLVGPHGVLYREAKSGRGVLEPEQRRWRDVLLAAGQDWALWRPQQWHDGTIRAELTALAKGEVAR